MDGENPLQDSPFLQGHWKSSWLRGLQSTGTASLAQLKLVVMALVPGRRRRVASICQGGICRDLTLSSIRLSGSESRAS